MKLSVHCLEMVVENFQSSEIKIVCSTYRPLELMTGEQQE